MVWRDHPQSGSTGQRPAITVGVAYVLSVRLSANTSPTNASRHLLHGDIRQREHGGCQLS
ncbi:hypothetical protein HMPREF3193_00222 [Bifidobacterium breve]|nr:hypothetical protein HMPREF3193_00222 [Bifidobacterium breve]